MKLKGKFMLQNVPKEKMNVPTEMRNMITYTWKNSELNFITRDILRCWLCTPILFLVMKRILLQIM